MTTKKASIETIGQRAVNLSVFAEDLYLALVDQAKKTAKAADGSPDGWRNYLDIRTKSLIKKGEEVFGEVG